MADLKDDAIDMKTRISTSKVSCQRPFDSVAADDKHGSTLAFEDNNTRCDEADMQSSDGCASTLPTSVKSEISMEMHLPLGNGSFEMVVEKMQDSQHRTESSCSNSLPVVLPVSFLNQSIQETSKEALFRNCGSSMDSSNSKAFDRSPEEPVTGSSESGVSAQNASETVQNVKAWNSMMISLKAENHGSLMIKKVEVEISRRWGHGTTTPEGNVGEVSEQTGNLDSYNCKTKSAESKRFSDGSIAGFDLNEDINPNLLDACVQPVASTIFSYGVMHVVAKAGIPIGQPMMPLKFEGGLGWKGAAKTSAFRPASLSKNLNRKTHSTAQRQKDKQGFTGIDLNVAAIEDDDANEIHSEEDPKHFKSLGIDLNCLYDVTDEFSQPSPAPVTENFPRVDLNTHTSVANKSNNVHWLSKTSDTSNPRKQDFHFTSHEYLPNLRAMQHLANSGHSLFGAPNHHQPMESIHRVASMQPKLPPHNYAYKDPFHFGGGPMPYTRCYGEHASSNARYLGHVAYEHSTSNISASAPKFDDKNEENLSISGSQTDESRPFPFLAKSSAMGEHMHQEAWYEAASTKRKEPEGGLEFYQLGCKQVT